MGVKTAAVVVVITAPGAVTLKLAPADPENNICDLNGSSVAQGTASTLPGTLNLPGLW